MKRQAFAESPSSRERRLYERGRRGVADLELRSVEEGESFGRYLLKPSGRWVNYTWIEIVTLRGGVLIHGDCDSCLFSGFSHTDPQPRGPIYWQARVNPGYGAEKAGYGGSKNQEWCRERAAYCVLDWRRQKSIDRDVARELYDSLRRGSSEHEFVADCWAHNIESEDIGHACDAVSRNVINAQCVLMHLVQLLERRDFQQQARVWFTREVA